MAKVAHDQQVAALRGAYMADALARMKVRPAIIDRQELAWRIADLSARIYFRQRRHERMNLWVVRE
jgi:hypothetical protein